jgi:hypothetical protein
MCTADAVFFMYDMSSIFVQEFGEFCFLETPPEPEPEPEPERTTPGPKPTFEPEPEPTTEPEPEPTTTTTTPTPTTTTTTPIPPPTKATTAKTSPAKKVSESSPYKSGERLRISFFLLLLSSFAGLLVRLH